jgi:excinuclease UvrABC nuclease subunit
VSAREYGKTIRNIELFFLGKKTMLVRNLEREMKSEAKALHFERAGELKKTLFALAHIQDVALLKRDMFGSVSESSSRGSFGVPRIEAYDVAHLGGSETVGVMTVVRNGETEKGEYRKFLIRETTNGNDFAALEELLRRRFGHPEWPFPDLVVVDGSHLQRHVAESVLRDFAIDIPVVSVVKNEHHQPKGILGPKKERDTHRDAILLANSESHRFAISFHRKRRGKSFLKQ